MDDKQLVSLLAADPEEGLKQAVRIYSAYVYRIAYSKLGDVCTKEDIEEAVSDVFVSFYSYVTEHGSSLHSAAAMLSVIAKRRCTDVFRERCRQAETLPLEYADDHPGDDIFAEKSELISAIKALGRPDSEIFLRRYYLGESAKEIGSALDMKPNTVNKRISRGLEKLREMLKEGEK
ncbi:sigma-70 family RNA polymerase sigma factor [Ruminococcus sp. NK3A76]|uniref:RNA polymerase sigma factor n=1 Tax=Ruminococcus sp. NK3A76 TaxID=877411 RepID=UPI00055FA95A|nr:sigma-70 family RNA polymerase sigma factor [Ruminococcus sp. NK3A76]